MGCLIRGCVCPDSLRPAHFLPRQHSAGKILYILKAHRLQHHAGLHAALSGMAMHDKLLLLQSSMSSVCIDRI